MIKIYNSNKFKSRKDILGDYRGELTKRLKAAKKSEYPKFDETLSFSIYDKIYAPKNPGVYFIHDKRGFLYIVGRVKDMIIRGGINIYPSEIEDILNKHEYVLDTSVIAWPSKELGEEVAAFVVKNNVINEEDLMQYLKEFLAPYKIPKQIFFIDDLPKSAQGKVLKSELTKKLPKI